MIRFGHVLVGLVAAGCGTSEPTGEPAWFPPDYESTYQQVRDCQLSLEHSSYMRILVSEDAIEAFGRTAAFPVGSIVLKVQYRQSDVACGNAIEAYTVMRKLPGGSSVETLDWEWQEVGANLRDRQVEIESCVSCHKVCGKSPMGYDGTCTQLE